jgi:hypothetical protein
MSIQGNIKPMRSLAEPLQVAMDNGARKALIPLENKRNFLEVSGDVVERVDPVFFSDPTTAAGHLARNMRASLSIPASRIEVCLVCLGPSPNPSEPSLRITTAARIAREGA